MTNEDMITLFKLRTGETDDSIVSSFLLEAKQKVLDKTNRAKMIDELTYAQLSLAICLWNKRGNEGLSSYSEGGENESYQSESEILDGISIFRLSPIARRMKVSASEEEES